MHTMLHIVRTAPWHGTQQLEKSLRKLMGRREPWNLPYFPYTVYELIRHANDDPCSVCPLQVALRVFKEGHVEGLTTSTSASGTAATSTPAPEVAGSSQGKGENSDGQAAENSAESAEASKSLNDGASDAAAATQQESAESKEVGASKPELKYTGPVITIDKGDLKEYVGQAPFAQDRFYETTPPGVVLGLAWTAMGGATLYIEAAKVHDAEARGALTTTGARDTRFLCQ